MRRPLLVETTTTFSPSARIGVLMPPATGASILARLLSGIEEPDSGTVSRTCRVSWPIGFAGFFHAELTGNENIASISEIAGFDPAVVMAFCQAFLGDTRTLNARANTISPVERSLLAFACSMAIPTDIYIADGAIGAGDRKSRQRCEALVKRRLGRAGLVFFSRNDRQLADMCDTFYVIANHSFRHCPSLKVARMMVDDISSEDATLAKNTSEEEYLDNAV